MQQDERLTYSVKEVAARLGVCPASVRNGISVGDIPALWIGRRVVIPKHQFERWLAGETHSKAMGE